MSHLIRNNTRFLGIDILHTHDFVVRLDANVLHISQNESLYKYKPQEECLNYNNGWQIYYLRGFPKTENSSVFDRIYI